MNIDLSSKLQLLSKAHSPPHLGYGATLTEQGVNFALWSEHATRVELCVFDETGELELRRFELHKSSDALFHGFLQGAGKGLVYAYRVHGPDSIQALEQGHRFDAQSVLMDPYAKSIIKVMASNGKNRYLARVCEHDIQGALKDIYRKEDNSNHQHLLMANQVILYEVHVNSFNALQTELPQALRGTYAGLAHPHSIAYFKQLGVNTLSLLPIHYHVDEAALVARGMKNYWGYNTLGFFCPDPSWAACDNRDVDAVNREFRDMVNALHAAGIQVVLDVVFNHTAEEGEGGPIYAFKGIDNVSWYRLTQHDSHRHQLAYENTSGCGNALNVAHPRVTQFVMDSLRYWVQVMGVDGFRFDLTTTLARNAKGDFDTQCGFFTALRQDPVLSRALLIAEPWDGGDKGYQLGHYPGRFMEWNDKFRDVVRRFWLKRDVSCGEFARRFMASSDVFHTAHRSPLASVNFITAHDGFCLRDAVSYESKHNHANGEDNRDGRDGEISCNMGVEGDTQDAQILKARERVSRAMLASLLFAQGTPMLCAGDEMSRTQRGNNNAYCQKIDQDNAISWLDWAHADERLMSFVQKLLALRAQELMLRSEHWFGTDESAYRLQWRRPDGEIMQVHDWHSINAFASLFHSSTEYPVASIGIHASAELQTGHRALYLAFNPLSHVVDFKLPDDAWQLLIDTANDQAGNEVEELTSIQIDKYIFKVQAQSLVLLGKT